jgi:hypothetical protein
MNAFCFHRRRRILVAKLGYGEGDQFRSRTAIQCSAMEITAAFCLAFFCERLFYGSEGCAAAESDILLFGELFHNIGRSGDMRPKHNLNRL